MYGVAHLIDIYLTMRVIGKPTRKTITTQLFNTSRVQRTCYLWLFLFKFEGKIFLFKIANVSGFWMMTMMMLSCGHL